MKVSKEKKYVKLDNTINYMALINDLQDEYGEVYWTEIEGIVFIYRPLGRNEYKQVLKADISEIEKEDAICQACLLHPKDFDFDNCLAGIPTQLFKVILKNSFLDSIESKKLIVAHYRGEMNEFDNHITCIISEAFPQIPLEEIESWNMSKTAKYLSRAEWKLNILRQIPIDYDVSDQLMEEEWYNDHRPKEDEEQSIQVQEKEEDVDTREESQQSASSNYVKNETIQERLARLQKEGPRKKTPEEIAEYKRRFPEMNWDCEIDPNDIGSAQETVYTESVALRPGW